MSHRALQAFRAPPRSRRIDTGHGPSRPLAGTFRIAVTCLVVFALLLAGPLHAAKKPKIPDDLAPQYKHWLTSVELLMTDAELAAFLKLDADYQRDAFIQRFWRMRDKDTTTARNEFREQWEAMSARVESEFGGALDDRGRMLLLNGPPTEVIEGKCPGRLWPLEIWYYQRSWAIGEEFLLIFYRPHGGGPFRLWHPVEGLAALTDGWSASSSGAPGGGGLRDVAFTCPDGDRLAASIAWVIKQGTLGFDSFLARMESARDEPSSEWVSTFDAYSTQLPEGAGTFDASLDLTFPGRRQSRTITQGLVSVPVDAVGTADLAGNHSYNFLLNGEVLKDGELFESFRYKFDYPASQILGDRIPLVFERALRAAEYTLVVKVEDLNTGAFYRHEQPLTVPEVEKPPPPPAPDDPVSARLMAEANAILSEGETTLKLVQPQGELLTDMIRFDTLTTGDVEKVAFTLDGQTILTDSRPPFSVELDLGDLPRTHSLRATGFDAENHEQAADEILINAGGTRFRVRLTEPRRDRTYEDSMRIAAELEVPEGDQVDRVELFLNETPVATLYGEPWSQPVVVPPEMRSTMGYVRAVAYLDDGSSTEDTVFVNAPSFMEEVDVQFVELYTTVLDRAGRPVQGLGREDFRVFEEGEEQRITRFEQVRDLPIHTAILLDVSASMGESASLEPARDAALRYFQQTLRPKDRGAIVTFNDRPHLAVQFTNDVDTLAGGLAGLKAERGTALHDSLIFSLYYFNGIRGQKALLLLSDGKDESSRFAYQDALEYARRAGVTIYAIGLQLPRGEPRRSLTKIAEETGGRSFFIDSADALEGIYAQVEEELRSQYLIAYQSANPDTTGAFREVDLEVLVKGLEAKTMTGYYP